MRRRTLLAGAGLAATAALAGCIETVDRGPVSREFDDAHDVDDGVAVVVTNPNGPVTVEKHGGSRVRVSGVKHARTEEGLDSITVAVEAGDPYRVAVEFATEPDDRTRRVDLTVEVPDRATVSRVAGQNGVVTVEGVAGDLEAVSSNGDVEVTGVEGFVRCRTDNGDVTARDCDGLDAARTANGEVDVDLLDMRGDVACTSSNGPVTAHVDQDISAAIELRTTNGSAKVQDLPYEAATETRNVVVGSLRGGEDPLLSLETGNGDVTLRPY